MRVELPKALSILAHEVRGSLGVIQGYLRMLRDGVADPALSARMWQAMQDATSRIAAITREASELAAWTDGRRPETSERLGVEALVRQVAERAGPGDRVAIDVPAALAEVQVTSRPAGMMAAALAAVLAAARREAPAATFGVRAQRYEGDVVLLMAPLERLEDESSTGAPFAFDGGGAGLALVLASHVLEAHGTTVTTAADSRAVVAVRLQKDGGTS
jgi:signal transduction histidine kinase